MATTTFELKSWLTDLGIGGDDLALIETKLGPAADKIGAGILRQADYSREMDKVQSLQREIATKDERLTQEAAEWANMTATEQAANKTLRDSMEKLEADRLRLTQRLTRVATEAGLDPAKALEGLEQEPVTKPVASPTALPAGFDPANYVSVEQYRALAGTAVRLPAQLAAIAREHRALIGTDVDEMAIISEIEHRATTRGNTKSLDPRQVWEEMHEIPAKRVAKSEATRQAELAAAREEGRAQAFSEASLPGGTPRGRNAPVFATQASGSKLQRPQPGSSVAGAVAAFDSGKYRQKTA